MKETMITRDRIKNHFAYSWWKYALLAVLAVFGWNLIFTTTAYKPPRNKRLDITFVTYSLPEEVTSEIRVKTLARYPEIEDSNVTSIVYTDDDNYYGNIQLTTYTGAGEGDIYIMPRERFLSFVGSGAFSPLDDAIASGALDLQGIDVSKGVATEEDGLRAVYGIPAAELYGMMDLGIDNRELMICVMAYSPNQERAVDWVGWWVEEMLAPKPEWLVEQEAARGTTTTEISDMPSY